MGARKRFNIKRRDIQSLPDHTDRRLLAQLFGNRPDAYYGYTPGYNRYGYGYNYEADYSRYTSCELAPECFETLLPQLCASERFGWLSNTTDDNGAPQ